MTPKAWYEKNPTLGGSYWAFAELHYGDLWDVPRPRVAAIKDVQRLTIHCCLCGKDGQTASSFAIKTPASPKGTYGALSTHVLRHHQSLQALVEARLGRNERKPQVKMEVKFKRENPMEARFLRSLVDWLAGDLLPLSVVDSPRFRDMIQVANPNLWVPSRGTLAQRDIPERARSLMKQNVFSKMAKAGVLHLSFDLWMNKRYESFGLYTTFVEKSPTSWVIVEACLGIFDAPDVKGDKLSNNLEAFLSQPDLLEMSASSKIFSTTSDGGLNLKKMVNALEDRVGCTSIFADLTKPIVSDCCAHLVHNVAKYSAATKHYRIAEMQALGVPEPQHSVSEITGHFLNGTTALKKSHPTWLIFCELCKQSNLKAVTISNPSLTRWLGYYSYLLLLQRFQVPYTAVWSRCVPALRIHAPPAWIWEYVNCIVKALEPLFFLIKKLQRQAQSFLLSDALAAVMKTQIAYNQLLQKELKEVQAAASCTDAAALSIHMLNNINRAFRKNFNFLYAFSAKKAHYLIALLLDPRYKDLALLLELYESEGNSPADARQKRRELLQEVFAGPLEAYLTAARLHLFPPSNNSEAKSGPSVPAAIDFADLIKSAPQPLPNLTPSELAMKEFTSFLVTQFADVHPKLSPLEFWPRHADQLPTVSFLAEAFCGLNKSEVKVESLFSVCGILTVDRRNSLGESLRNAYCQIWSALPRNRKAKPSHDLESTAAATANDKALHFAEEENELLKDTEAGPNGFAQIGLDDEEQRFLDLLECLEVLKKQPLDMDFLNNEGPFSTPQGE